MATIISKQRRTRCKNSMGVLIPSSEYATIGVARPSKAKVYVRAAKPNRMKAIMVAASFATFMAFFEYGGYDEQGAKWCNEVYQISRFYQGDFAPTRA